MSYIKTSCLIALSLFKRIGEDIIKDKMLFQNQFNNIKEIESCVKLLKVGK